MLSGEIRYREATAADAPFLAALRTRSGWEGGGSEDRMRGYLLGEHHPQQALAPRTAFVAEHAGEVAGFIAGHLTRRLGCDGELQWLLVSPGLRGLGVADALWHLLSAWFGSRGATSICVNVEPGNDRARAFYARHGATPHASHWMIWQQPDGAHATPAGPRH